VRRPLTAVCVLLAAQGVIGTTQYALELPAELVWLHVALASLTWLSLLWSVAAAGRPAPRSAPSPAPRAMAAR
jgi:cytochrome c oxidase assembly protein subunit 15